MSTLDSLILLLSKQNPDVFELEKQDGGVGTVATSTNPGIFTPTYGSGKRKRNFSSLLKEWLEKQRRAYHRHEGWPEHPIAVKRGRHEEYFRRKGMQVAVRRPDLVQTPKEIVPAQDQPKQQKEGKTAELHNKVREALEKIDKIADRRNQYNDAVQQIKALRNIEVVKGKQSFLNELDKRLEYFRNMRRNEDDDKRLAEGVKTRAERELEAYQEKKLEIPFVPSFEMTVEEKDRSKAPVGGEEHLGGGANVTKTITLSDGKKMVFKPKNGERKELRNDIPYKTYYKREVAAYVLAKWLGMEKYVPITVIKVVKGEIGSAQDFVPDDELKSKCADLGVSKREDVTDAALLNMLFGNEDRHGGNAMVRKDGTLVLIDHGLCFPNGNKPKEARSLFIEEKNRDFLDENHKKILENFIANQEQVRKILFSLLEPEAIDGIFWRAQKALEKNNYTLGWSW